MVSDNEAKRIDDLEQTMTHFHARQQESTNTIHLVAIAVDEHTHHPADMKTRLDMIDKKLNPTRV
jgi:hypothetical protein